MTECASALRREAAREARLAVFRWATRYNTRRRHSRRPMTLRQSPAARAVSPFRGRVKEVQN